MELQRQQGAGGGSNATGPDPAAADNGLRDMYCTSLCFDRDFASWDPLKSEEGLITAFKGRLGLTADSVEPDAVRVISRRASLGVSAAGGAAPPAGNLVLDFEVKIPTAWTNAAQGQVYRSLANLKVEARKKQLMLQDLLVLEFTEPGPPPPPPPSDQVPAAPDGKPVVSKISDAADKMKLAWGVPPTDGGQSIVGYRIWMATGGSDFVFKEDTSSSGTEKIIEGLAPGESYKFKVAALNTAGQEGAQSVESAPESC